MLSAPCCPLGEREPLPSSWAKREGLQGSNLGALYRRSLRPQHQWGIPVRFAQR